MRMGLYVAAAMALRLRPSNVVTPVMRYLPALVDLPTLTLAISTC